jgi:hypothetical protein
MWCLAELRCPACQDEFYGALGEGHGLFAPALIRRSDGSIVEDGGTKWTAWLAFNLKEAYLQRTSDDLKLQVRKLRPVGERPLLVNCLDSCYGHALPKLFSLQYYLDRCPSYDPIVIIPRALEWLVPDGVAEIWLVDEPLRKLGGWHDGLGARFRELLTRWQRVWLASAPAAVHSGAYDIERFTGVQPFDVGNFGATKPVKITFIWRDDRVVAFGRTWPGHPPKRLRFGWYWQRRFVIAIAKALRNKFPDLDFAVAGLGTPGGFPNWIEDLRSVKTDLATERNWCRRYAASHLVVGVHGSNMMLPSAHAGSVLTLVPVYSLVVSFSDTILNGPQAGHPTMSTLLRYRSIPDETKAHTVAEWIFATVISFPGLMKVWETPVSHQEVSASERATSDASAGT